MAQTYKDCSEPRTGCGPALEGLLDPVLFRALGDPNRVALIALLGQNGRPTTVTEAAGCCPVDLSVVSRHLALLREAGVLRAAKQGREVRYTVSPGLSASLRALADALDACCPPESSGPNPVHQDQARRSREGTP